MKIKQFILSYWADILLFPLFAVQVYVFFNARNSGIFYPAAPLLALVLYIVFTIAAVIYFFKTKRADKSKKWSYLAHGVLSVICMSLYLRAEIMETAGLRYVFFIDVAQVFFFAMLILTIGAIIFRCIQHKSKQKSDQAVIPDPKITFMIAHWGDIVYAILIPLYIITFRVIMHSSQWFDDVLIDTLAVLFAAVAVIAFVRMIFFRSTAKHEGLYFVCAILPSMSMFLYYISALPGQSLEEIAFVLFICSWAVFGIAAIIRLIKLIVMLLKRTYS